MEKFSKRLAEALELRDMSAAELSRRSGVPKSAISLYLHQETDPRTSTIYALAKALNVSEVWLIGADGATVDRTPDYMRYPNVSTISVKRFPVLGSVAAGKPIYEPEEFGVYCAAGADIDADFCLRVKGDSMVGAFIRDGDIVFVRRQEMVENGEIAAVDIDGEATLKRVFYYPEKDLLILKPENTAYGDFIYSGEELNNVRILGKAVAFQSDAR